MRKIIKFDLNLDLKVFNQNPSFGHGPGPNFPEKVVAAVVSVPLPGCVVNKCRFVSTYTPNFTNSHTLFSFLLTLCPLM